jgi:hypothetical protein
VIGKKIINEQDRTDHNNSKSPKSTQRIEHQNSEIMREGM